VLKAIDNVHQIIGPSLVAQKFNVQDQQKIDDWLLSLDGTPNKCNTTSVC
jgi:enolase